MKKVAGFILLSIALACTVLSFQNCGKSFRAIEPTQLDLNTSLSKCSSTQSQACEVANGSGVQFCSDSGSPGACSIESCKSGFYIQNDTCLPLACTPQSSAACSERFGSGLKVCNASGTAFGDCQLSSCQDGYVFNSNTKACDPQCIANAPSSCEEANGTGIHICNSLGTAYGSCTLTSCQAGFNLQIAKCIPNACSPGTTLACAENSGAGIKTCNSTGTGYGACELKSCDSGFMLQGGVCVAVCKYNDQLIAEGGTINGFITQTTPYGVSCQDRTVTLFCHNGVFKGPPNTTLSLSDLQPSCIDGVPAPAHCFDSGQSCPSVLVLSEDSEACMDVNGSSAILKSCNGSPTQVWNIVSQGTAHVIVNNSQRTCLTLANLPMLPLRAPQQLMTAPCDNSISQQWGVLENQTFYSTSINYYKGQKIPNGWNGIYSMNSLNFSLGRPVMIGLHYPIADGFYFSTINLSGPDLLNLIKAP